MLVDICETSPQLMKLMTKNGSFELKLMQVLNLVGVLNQHTSTQYIVI